MAEHPKKLMDFLSSLEHRIPTVHDEITRHELKERGWDCKDTKHDVQLLRLVSLAAQMFIAGVSHDSMQIHQQRRKQAVARLKEQGLYNPAKVLTMEDTAAALKEYGVNMKPAPYYLDDPK